MGPQQLRHPSRLARGLNVEPGPNIHGQHQVDIELGGGFQRHDATESAVAKPAPIDENGRVVHWQRATGAKHIHQRSALRPGAEEHQLAAVQIDCGYRKRKQQVGELAVWHQRFDGRAQRSRLEERAEVEPGHRC
jgi:hypothetical protein